MAVLNFMDFLAKYFPLYRIDGANTENIKLLGLWAMRDKRYEDSSKQRYLGKGITLSGNVGSGKTELFRMLNFYLKYLRSPYTFKCKVVWQFADSYKKIGVEAFAAEYKGDVFYDELLLINDTTNQPDVENVGHYGDRVLIGEKLIRLRYNAWKEYGYQSHFTTNASWEELKTHYGARAFSRFCEMTTIIPMIGEDRRKTVQPAFYRDVHNPTEPLPTSISQDEELELKRSINKYYTDYCNEGKLPMNANYLYNQLALYGVDVMNDKELNDVLADIYTRRISEITTNLNDETLQNPLTKRRNISLSRQYETGKLDADERALTWNEAKQEAVKQYFDKLKEKKCTYVFEL